MATSTITWTCRTIRPCAWPRRSPLTPRWCRCCCPAGWPRGRRWTTAFCQTVSSFDGSVAVAVSAAARPDQLLLALRGSGQSLNVGLAEDAFIVASEAYGLVQETASYIRMDGETSPAGPTTATAAGHATGSGPGQVVVLDRSHAGTLAGRVSIELRRRAPPARAGRGPKRRDHDPRHRPGRLSPLPPEGDLRSPPVVPQDAAGQDLRRRPQRAALRPGRSRRPATGGHRTAGRAAPSGGST